MPVRYGELLTTGDVGGPNPTDAFSIAFELPETLGGQTDDVSVAFEFPEQLAGQTDTVQLGLDEPDTIGSVDDLLLSLGLTATDTNAVPTDADTYAVTLAATDTNTTPTETVTLSFTLDETGGAATDDRRATATWRQGATTAASTGADAWPNPTNAQDLNDGVTAVAQDNTALGSRSFALTLSAYPDPVADFSSWTISTVKVYYYADYNRGISVTGGVVLEYRLSGAGAYTELEDASASFDSLAAPKVFDITTDVAGDWNNVNGFNARIRYTSELAETSSCAVDAVELEVVATKDPL